MIKGLKIPVLVSQRVCYVITSNPEGIPFALIYLLVGTGWEARLQAKEGSIPKSLDVPIISFNTKLEAGSNVFSDVLECKNSRRLI